MKKHILIISLHADPMLPAGIGENGGGHMYPYELLVGLSKEEYIVSLVTRKSDKTLADIESINASSTIYRLDYGNIPFHDKKDFYNLRDKSLSLTNQLLQKYNIRPNIIHSLYWNSGYLAYQLSKQLKIPYVHSPISIGYIIKKEQAKEIEIHRIATEQIVFENAARILSITESEKENIIKYYNIRKCAIEVIGRPISKEYLYPVHDEWGNSRDYNMNYPIALTPKNSSPMPISENWWEKKAFIYVGRIHPNKGIHYILKAWLQLKQKYNDICPPLWLVGGTPAEINQFHIEQNLNLDYYEKNGEIIWWGRLNAEGISTLYTRSLALIMHSKYEPGGRVSVEAMSAGLPVIATPCGFAKDMVANWETGFLVNFGNIELLAHWMSMFILQPYLANSLGSNAKKVALSTTQKWSFMQHHIHIYEQVSSKRNISQQNNYSNLMENELVWGFVHTYPFHFSEASNHYILQKFQHFGIKDISIEKQKSCKHLGCYLWTAINDKQEYHIIQPYNLVNIRRLVDINRYSKTIYADANYHRIREWANVFPTTILSFDDKKQIIISDGSPLLHYTEEDYIEIIRFIQNYKHTISSESVRDIVVLLKKTTDVSEILTQYQILAETYNWFSQDDFSILVESKWLLDKIEEDSELKSLFQPQIIDFFQERSNATEKTVIVFAGLIYPGSLCKQNGTLTLSVPIAIHGAENGYDEGMLLIYTGQGNHDAAYWRKLVKEIPLECRYQAVQWAIIFLSKQLLLFHTMVLSTPMIFETKKYLEILIEIALTQND